jgi:DNA-binding response OmpR family regulator
MIVDDEPELALIVKKILSSEYKVTGVGSGEKALSLTQEEMPDLVLLDIMMPGMDGWEFLGKFRKLKGSENVPVIILSARSKATEVLSAMSVEGVADYITKPFTKDEIRNRVKRALGNG